jgi:hypothetical protein
VTATLKRILLVSVCDAWHHDGMSNIVNLRRVRKARAREQAAEQAAANRAMTGRTKAERSAVEKELASTERALDGAKIDKPGTA